MKNSRLSRREFLKHSLTAAFGGMMIHSNFFDFFSSIEPSSPILGRVLYDNEIIYYDPSYSSKVKYYLGLNDVLPIGDFIISETINENNRLWYEVKDYGYLPANSVQIVRQRLNPVKEAVNSGGELGIVTIPYTQAWKANGSHSNEHQLFYYGSTHWVNDVYTDSKGDTYYRIVEDRWNDVYYVLAQHVELQSDDDLMPFNNEIAPEEKTIEVNIQDQTVIAYEKGIPVFFSPASTGLLNSSIDLSTPPGEYIVNYKRPSRHMVHTDKIGVNDSELYGVPWVSYFTDTGIAFHGTYWHNDFGTPRSHGCVNLPIPAAQWIYHWTNPVVPPRADTFVSRYGTRVIVI